MNEQTEINKLRGDYLELLKNALTGALYPESAWKVLEQNKHQRHPQKLSITKPIHFFHTVFRDAIVGSLRKKRLLLLETYPFNITVRENGSDWPFIGYTMVGLKRLENVHECFRDVLLKNIPGDLVETGAWRGGMTIFMRALLKAYGILDRRVWVADSFEGLPAPKDSADGWDMSKVNQLKVSLEEVKANFERFGLLDKQVKFIKGWFCDSLPNAPIEKLAILRLDGDLYHSTMDVLKNLYHKVSKGGYVVVDDYYSWSSCRKAVTDFLKEKALTPDIKGIGQNLGAYWKVQ